MVLGIIPGASDSVSKAFIDLKANLNEEKSARLAAQIEVNILSRVVKDLKIYADRFAT
jgi:hypothetical protein